MGQELFQQKMKEADEVSTVSDCFWPDPMSNIFIITLAGHNVIVNPLACMEIFKMSTEKRALFQVLLCATVKESASFLSLTYTMENWQSLDRYRTERKCMLSQWVANG